METIGERIAKFIDLTEGLNRAGFAKRLNITPAFVTKICSNDGNPSDRTIAAICREFNVNEQWLRTGEGEMLVQLTPSEELAAFTAQLQREDSFRRRFIAALSTLDPGAWDYVEQFMRQLIAENEEKTDP